MHMALQKVDEWARKNNTYLKTRKSEGGIFTRNAREKEKDLKLEDDGAQNQDRKKGFVLRDQGGPGTEVWEPSGEWWQRRRETRIPWALAENDWGWGREAMIHVYKAMVESCLWYGSSAWIPWLAWGKIEKLEQTESEDLKAVTGLAKTSRKSVLTWSRE